MKAYAQVAVPAPFYPTGRLLDYRVPPDMAALVEPGSLVEVPLNKRKTWGVVFALKDQASFDDAKIKSLLGVKLDAPVFDAHRLNLLTWLSRHYFHPIGEVCETALPASIREGTARTLKLGDEERASSARRERPKDLSPAQRKAFSEIIAGGAGPHLLWGVTGSGKTEVYLQVIAEVLKSGKDALVLVPEIALTPQLRERFEERFPGEIAVFHSAQKATALRRAWLDVWSGKKRIAVGARSAVFAPLQNPGIIIVDEEHDSSYKQEERLRYNARDVTLAMGALYNIPVVLGSATPSAETLHAVSTGKCRISKLPERAVESAVHPEIMVVDLKKSIAVENKDPKAAPREDGVPLIAPEIEGDFFLSPELRSAMQTTLAADKQVILFLNRRGLGSQELCRSCGHIMTCPACAVNLTPHHHGLLCHYCGFGASIPTKCPSCNRADHPFLRVGTGTEAIEAAVAFHFPKAKILRLDRDTADSPEALEEIVRTFSTKGANILIGTQMVAKGHDFPDVTLVGVLLADIGLSMPDFRAHERCLQLLLQVSGRAGRGIHPGRVIVQAFQPEHSVFKTLVNAETLENYAAFIDEELAKRAALKYPPHSRLVLLKLDGTDEDKVAEAGRAVGTALKKVAGKSLQVLGPVVAPIGRIRGRHRWQVLVKAHDHHAVDKAVHWILDGWEREKLESRYRTRLIIDVDPLQML